MSFLTGADLYTSGTLQNGKDATIKIDTKSIFQSVDFSFPVEAGYTLTLATKRSTSKMEMNLYARYEYGFLEIFRDPAVGTSRISLFQIGVSYPFIKTAEELSKNKK